MSPTRFHCAMQLFSVLVGVEKEKKTYQGGYTSNSGRTSVSRYEPHSGMDSDSTKWVTVCSAASICCLFCLWRTAMDQRSNYGALEDSVIQVGPHSHPDSGVLAGSRWIHLSCSYEER